LRGPAHLEGSPSEYRVVHPTSVFHPRLPPEIKAKYGGVDPNELCNVELCIENATFKQVCIDEINDCIATGRWITEQCVAFGTEICTA